VSWVLVGNCEVRRLLGRARRRREDDIKIDLKEVECGYVDWVEVAQDRDRQWALVIGVMNLGVP
jgi:hypothetical protein